MTAPRAIIYGCEGTSLGKDESAFLRDADPWGFILFARNIERPEQVERLTDALRRAVGRDAPVLIDQEGGRVARLRKPHWREWLWTPALRERLSGEALDEAIALRFRLIAHELAAVGIDVNCMPILDVPNADADPIIADRALGADAEEVARHGRIAAEALMAGGVAPVVKHMPGQGRGAVDSHHALPRVDAPLEALREVDFAPFRAMADLPMGMTAHVVFDAIDPQAPVTTSPAGIRAIREEIGFDGLLMTDDLDMKALAGPPAERAAAAIAAGCDMILHCNGTRAQMQTTAAVVPQLSGEALRRADAALAARGAAQGFDPAAADARLARLSGEGADV
ncbi:MAG: glycoside hydrolase family 3 N-terminal domain-containing protein [Pseudomonadota bacterium]